MKKFISLGFVLSAMPFVAFAAADAESILSTISYLLKLIMPLLVGLAAVWFVWGVITYIAAKDEEQKKAGRTKLINGLVGLFVMVAFWGIIAIVIRSFDMQDNGQGIIKVPAIPPIY